MTIFTPNVVIENKFWVFETFYKFKPILVILLDWRRQEKCQKNIEVFLLPAVFRLNQIKSEKLKLFTLM